MKNIMFSNYINALKIVHQHEECWILDNKFKIVHDNNPNHSLKSLQVISETRTSSSLLSYLVKNHHNIDSNDVVVFSNEISTDQLLLLNISQIVHDGDILGYFLLFQGKVDDFEHLKLLNLLLHGNKQKTNSEVELEEREKEILYYISRGKSYREIATSLSDRYHKRIALSTIASIVRNSLYEKLGVYNMLDLKSKAIELNLNHVPPSLFCRGSL
ncbi:MAG: hypothetical protein ACK5Z5_00550 [Neisseriaceae bacterium]